VYAQALFSQRTVAFSRGGQGMQLGPQKLTSLFGTQVPLQSRWPVGQVPLQAWLLGTQAPAQSLVPWGHWAPHLTPSQVAVPPVGMGQGVQEVPQLVGLVSLKQASLQRWKPGLHLSSHLSPSQVEMPSGDDGQGEQEEPQALRLLRSTQMPLQRFLPSGQAPSQGAPSGTQLSRQGFWPAGQETPHRVPSQVAVPPLMVGQDSHETPQVSGDVLLAQRSWQRWNPAGQLGSSGLTGSVGSGAGPSETGLVGSIPGVVGLPTGPSRLELERFGSTAPSGSWSNGHLFGLTQVAPSRVRPMRPTEENDDLIMALTFSKKFSRTLSTPRRCRPQRITSSD
jgi:hypothetical protein